jgi:hypothetical protein
MRFIQDKSGTAVVVLGLALPALVGGVAAAVDHANLASRRAKLQVDTSKNPLGARIWGAGCVNDGREHGIWASMVRFAG